MSFILFTKDAKPQEWRICEKIMIVINERCVKCNIIPIYGRISLESTISY